MKEIQKNWLEWAVFSGGLILVLATLGYLSWDSLNSGDTPPKLEVRLEKARATTLGAEKYFVVPVTVKNHGDKTADGVHVQVTLEFSEGEPEEADFDIQFLPRQSTREGSVVFSRDPEEGRLTGRILGYEIP